MRPIYIQSCYVAMKTKYQRIDEEVVLCTVRLEFDCACLLAWLQADNIVASVKLNKE